jgi:Thermostable hemolysin
MSAPEHALMLFCPDLPGRVGASPSAFGLLPPAPIGRTRFGLHPPGDALRPEVEATIRRVYAERFDARVRSFAPMLVSLHEGEGAEARIAAAAGYRIATQPLFLETYLDRPVDELLAVHGARPARDRIVEVGHLAAARSGEGRRLILRLAQEFARLEIEWVVGTLTEELRALFQRMGIVPIALGAADPARLGTAAADWGSYYDHHPIVLAGHLPVALRRLARRGAEAV